MEWQYLIHLDNLCVKPLVKDCQFGVSPVNYSDSDSGEIRGKSLVSQKRNEFSE